MQYFEDHLKASLVKTGDTCCEPTPFWTPHHEIASKISQHGVAASISQWATTNWGIRFKNRIDICIKSAISLKRRVWPFTVGAVWFMLMGQAIVLTTKQERKMSKSIFSRFKTPNIAVFYTDQICCWLCCTCTVLNNWFIRRQDCNTPTSLS